MLGNISWSSQIPEHMNFIRHEKQKREARLLQCRISAAPGVAGAGAVGVGGGSSMSAKDGASGAGSAAAAAATAGSTAEPAAGTTANQVPMRRRLSQFVTQGLFKGSAATAAAQTGAGAGAGDSREFDYDDRGETGSTGRLSDRDTGDDDNEAPRASLSSLAVPVPRASIANSLVSSLGLSRDTRGKQQAALDTAPSSSPAPAPASAIGISPSSSSSSSSSKRPSVCNFSPADMAIQAAAAATKAAEPVQLSPERRALHELLRPGVAFVKHGKTQI